MSAPLRIGVAGLGAVAQSVHLPLIQRRWDLFELAAVADLSPSLLAQVGTQFGVPDVHRYGSLGEMLAQESLDGVVLLTSGSHGAAALEAIEAGVAVFCEKPLAFSLGEIDALRKAEAEQGRPMLLLGYMKEYDPATRALKACMPAPEDIRYVNVEVLHPSGESQLAYANLRPPAGDIPGEVLEPLLAADQRCLDAALGADAPAQLRKLYANVVLGSLIHDIALLRSLFGPVRTVDAAHYWAQQDNPGSLEISGTIGEGARVHLNWHFLADYPAYRETLTMHHTRGSAELGFTVPYLLNAPTTLRLTEKAGDGESRRTLREVTEAFELELAAFHALVRDGVPAPTGIAEGYADVQVGQLIARALARSLGTTINGEASEL
ncbi:Gfo/Idh/MocA family oxidoreductase [Paenarthrobacter sp. DKR-5]|uniref:Gfo/Idh/MocA family oxidoreductase n=1 Tax=Paenarthrobacter sp. DKR-5 TaxID=2835535 RepID=UPI001BDC3D31|nr:Gfo/Idh/MocA family oxidoreductase [Paenarthrobacter sp. DKR-5]MBT1002589.1 Gfo/Idh/MocA family oxidoreductase [Paenarthrobacter sp. DKR-5]